MIKQSSAGIYSVCIRFQGNEKIEKIVREEQNKLSSRNFNAHNSVK